MSECEHVWGTVTIDPWMDAGECIKCGVVWTCAQIARSRFRGTPFTPGKDRILDADGNEVEVRHK